uniref:Uncharacterized protein n=1 Tax=Timema poppense TaxID=170557 RepID=A0A7R9D694_TIMPO|nr:unnamed protein product [Timema poppensis]
MKRMSTPLLDRLQMKQVQVASLEEAVTLNPARHLVDTVKSHLDMCNTLVAATRNKTQHKEQQVLDLVKRRSLLGERAVRDLLHPLMGTMTRNVEVTEHLEMAEREKWEREKESQREESTAILRAQIVLVFESTANPYINSILHPKLEALLHLSSQIIQSREQLRCLEDHNKQLGENLFGPHNNMLQASLRQAKDQYNSLVEENPIWGKSYQKGEVLGAILREHKEVREAVMMGNARKQLDDVKECWLRELEALDIAIRGVDVTLKTQI